MSKRERIAMRTVIRDGKFSIDGVGIPWSDDEVAILHQMYPVGGSIKCMELMPSRSRISIIAKARRLGLRSGATNKRKHDYVGTRTYRAWYSAKQRCTNPHNDAYHEYGGIGLSFFDRWNDFLMFLKDMGEAPTNKHQIDRIDPNLGYYPGNCRWVLPVQNSANARIRCTNRVGFKGVIRLPSGNFRAICRHSGKTVFDGVFVSAEEAARAYDLALVSIHGEEFAMTNARMGLLNG